MEGVSKTQRPEDFGQVECVGLYLLLLIPGCSMVALRYQSDSTVTVTGLSPRIYVVVLGQYKKAALHLVRQPQSMLLGPSLED